MWISERKGGLVIAGILFSIGVVWILVSRTMPYGEFTVPGPGFFPCLLGVLLCGVSSALGIHTFLRRTPTQVRVGHLRIGSTVAALLGLAFFFESLGFVLSITLFLSVLLKTLSHLKILPCILWAAAGAIIAYLFFQLLLGIQLP